MDRRYSKSRAQDTQKELKAAGFSTELQKATVTAIRKLVARLDWGRSAAAASVPGFPTSPRSWRRLPPARSSSASLRPASTWSTARSSARAPAPSPRHAPSPAPRYDPAKGL